MNRSPLVSIIIDNFNYGRFIKEAIDSACNQSYANTEIIVVDDGSNDDSPDLILGYGNKITPILKQNGGQASAFNAGFRESKGDIIIFLDADDVLLPSAVEKVVALFDPETDAKVHWQLQRIDEAGQSLHELMPKETLAEGDLREVVARLGPAHCGGPPYGPPTSGNAWSRNFLEEVFPMPEKEFTQTADFYLMALAPVFGALRAIPEPLGLYRVHGSNSTLKANYLEQYMQRFEHCCTSLSKYLHSKGMEVDPGSWPRDHWFHLVAKALEDIKNIIAHSSSFILVDNNDLGTPDVIEGRRRFHFLEREGAYWGLPATDEEAIKELERQRRNGVTSIIFAWTCFWVLDHYTGLKRYLEQNYTTVISNSLLIGFSAVNN